MALTYTPIFPVTINNTSVQILPADTTTLKTIYTGATNGSRLENILVTNTDTAAASVVQVYAVISATNHLLGTVNVPISSGNLIAVPSVNLLSYSGNLGNLLNRDANGNTYLYVASGTIIKVAVTVAVNAGKILDFFAQGGDF
jgi:hypothetical protein